MGPSNRARIVCRHSKSVRLLYQAEAPSRPVARVALEKTWAANREFGTWASEKQDPRSQRGYRTGRLRG